MELSDMEKNWSSDCESAAAPRSLAWLLLISAVIYFGIGCSA